MHSNSEHLIFDRLAVNRMLLFPGINWADTKGFKTGIVHSWCQMIQNNVENKKKKIKATKLLCLYVCCLQESIGPLIPLPITDFYSSIPRNPFLPHSTKNPRVTVRLLLCVLPNRLPDPMAGLLFKLPAPSSSAVLGMKKSRPGSWCC